MSKVVKISSGCICIAFVILFAFAVCAVSAAMDNHTDHRINGDEYLDEKPEYNKETNLTGEVTLARYITASTIYVPDNYPTIQSAVDAASAGDTIIVRDGTYIENVNVNKRLTRGCPSVE
ncbi:MAG: hypothetical protein QMD80_08465 [archaeon]|nr:hypothetical protein [archaeon]